MMARLSDTTLELTMPDGSVRHVGVRWVTSVVHKCPPGTSGLTPCCGRTPFELPRTDRITVDRALVTCRAAA